jgi:hypothetical protein
MVNARGPTLPLITNFGWCRRRSVPAGMAQPGGTDGHPATLMAPAAGLT